MAQGSDARVLDTVIVGGGISGLTVGYRLRDRDILLLEKEDVAGGRTISIELGEYVYNAAAQVVFDAGSLVGQLADELDVPITLIEKTKIPLYMNGKYVTASTELGYLWKMPLPLMEKVKMGLTVLRLRRRYGSVGEADLDPSDPILLELDSMTADEVVRPSGPGTRALWDAVANSITSVPAAEASALMMVMALHHFRGDEYYVEGGTWQLTTALYERISDKVQLRADVQKIEEIDGAVRVTYEQGGQQKTVRARRCVVAVPGTIVPRIVEGLPAWKRDALSKIDYVGLGTVAFLHEGSTDRLMGEGVWRVPMVGTSFIGMVNPTFTFPKEVKERTGRGLIRLQTVDPVTAELARLSDGEATEILLDELVSVFPEIKDKVVGSAIRSWEYGISPWRPGRLRLVSALRAPTGNIHYCGDYVEEQGMVGAIRTAGWVLDDLKKQPAG